MSWIAAATFMPWVGGQFHLRCGGNPEDLAWPEWVARDETVDFVSTPDVINLVCQQDATVTVTVCSVEDVGMTESKRIHSQNLRLDEGRMAVGTVDAETVIALDGRPETVDVHIYSTRARDGFTIALQDGVTGRALVAPDDVGDDLLDVPRPADLSDDLLNYGGYRYGYPMLVVMKHDKTGEERVVSYRVMPERYPSVRWDQLGLVESTPETVKLARRLAASPGNAVGPTV